MNELDLVAEEDRAPSIEAFGSDNLWYQHGWVRGRWPITFVATDPSGVCSAHAQFGTLPGIATPTPDPSPNRHTFQQCPSQTVRGTVDTSASDGSLGRGEGTMPLGLVAANAAGVSTGYSFLKTVYVDNSAPTLSLGGPTDVPSTAGPQFVTARAGGSPSGIAGMLCAVDGGPPRWFPGASAEVPVSGVGEHTTRCTAYDNAVDPSGTHAQSAPEVWTMRIGQPTVLGASFSRVVDALKCAQVRTHVTIPGRWVTIHRHGIPVWVKTKSRTKTVTVTRCKAHTTRRRVVVLTTVRRNGHTVRVRQVRTIRVVLLPHVVNRPSRTVAFGRSTTVSGWLGTSSGTALAGQPVRVLTAPEDGQGRFTQTAIATTRADGSWSAPLGAGPSRLVIATYGGSATTEPTSAPPVRVSVPASIEIAAAPTAVPWGGHLRITGRVLGGYIPPGSNVLKLLFGDGPTPHTIGTPEISPDGRFSIPITWSTGRGVVHYWFAVATLAEADYPYAKGISRRLPVTVGRRG